MADIRRSDKKGVDRNRKITEVEMHSNAFIIFILGGSCGGIKRAISGSIVSTGGSAECHWLIQVNQGKKVNIRFTSFNLGDNDQVKIYDGQKYEEFVTFTKASKPRSITGNGHFMRVIYIGGKSAGSGFSLQFKEASMSK